MGSLNWLPPLKICEKEGIPGVTTPKTGHQTGDGYIEDPTERGADDRPHFKLAVQAAEATFNLRRQEIQRRLV